MWLNHLSAKETRQQNEQWECELEATGKGGQTKAEGLTKYEKGEQAIWGIFIKQGPRTPLPTMNKFSVKILVV